jgi:hypothetical protein
MLLDIYKKVDTVFTLKELSMMFPDVPYNNLKSQIIYFCRTGKLRNIRKGVYVKKDFDIYELANKLYTPSYLSLETVLQEAGVIFQYYSSIFAISYLSRTIEIDKNVLMYKKVKDDVLFNNKGVIKVGSVTKASPERAFLDAIFLYKNYFFDNLRVLNWDKVFETATIYSSKVLNTRIEEYYKMSKN